jgi:hypothetical protein
MQNIDENIDLDALFDSLSIGGSTTNKASDVAMVSHPGAITAEIQELSALDCDLFLFDSPPDQS